MILLSFQETEEFVTGAEASKMIGGPGEMVQRPQLENYQVFVQSFGSGARHLDADSIVLYKVARSMNDRLKFYASINYRVKITRY